MAGDAADMKTFRMNSLVGSDAQVNDILSHADEWVELDDETYRVAFDEVREDKASKLLEAINFSDQFSFAGETPNLDFHGTIMG